MLACFRIRGIPDEVIIRGVKDINDADPDNFIVESGGFTDDTYKHKEIKITAIKKSEVLYWYTKRLETSVK